MSVNDNDPSRMVPKGLDEQSVFLNFTRGQAMAIGVPTGVMLIFAMIMPAQISQYAIFFAGAGFIFGVLLTIRTPSHLEPTEWISGFTRYLTTPNEISHLQLQDGVAREQKDFISTKVYQINKRSQDFTHINKVHPESRAVERDDGVVVGAVRVEPVNMALASQQRWRNVVNQWESYLNNTVEYPIQIYVRSTPFEVDEYIKEYEQRLDDEDIVNNPILEEALESFLSWYPEYLMYQGTNEKEFYIIYTVDEDEIYGSGIEEETFTEKFAKLPVVGKFFESRLKKDSGSEIEKREMMFRELRRRVDDGIKHGVGRIEGCNGYSLTGIETAMLLKEFWSGKEHQQEMDMDEFPTIGLSVRGEEPVTHLDMVQEDSPMDMENRN